MSAHPSAFDKERVVGLIFATDDGWCLFQAACGIEFIGSVDSTAKYAVVDPESDALVGFYLPHTFVGPAVPLYRVYLLRPMIEESLA